MLKKEKTMSRDDFEKTEVWIDVILLAFDKPIKYDYYIPEIYLCQGIVEKVLPELKTKISSKIFETIKDISFVSKDYYSKIEDYLRLKDYCLGNEFFYGYGQLRRWREGEKENALNRIKKYIPENEQKYVKIVQEVLKNQIEKSLKYENN